MYKIFTTTALISLIALLFATQPHASPSLWYTIQTGSFESHEAATPLFEKLGDALPREARENLRIEHISRYYVVRIGKFTSSQEASPLLTTIKKYVKSSYIMKAFIKPGRISRRMSTLPNEPSRPTKEEASGVTRTHAVTYSPFKGAKNRRQPQNTNQPTELTTQLDKLSPKQRLDALIKKYVATEEQRNSEKKERARQLSKAFPATPSCVTSNCHPEMTAFTTPHSPVESRRCKSCHKQINKQHPQHNSKSFKTVKEGADLCFQCHPKKGQGKVVHGPLLKGDCRSCHAPHGSENKALLIEKNQKELCFTCHDTPNLELKYKHGPFDLGACSYCHDPHSSDFPNLLKKPPQDLCFSCHQEISQGLNNAAYVHTPLKDQGCLSCHNPHTSKFPNLLSERGQNFCFTCHQKTHDEFEKSRTKHAGLYLEDQCATCHQPHYSQYKALLNLPEKDLCFTCHGNNSSVESYSPPNIEKEISGKEYVHAPVAKGECSGCHMPHGSKYKNLLVQEYPDTFYAPYSIDKYALCFTCHDSGLLSEVETDSSTLFRNGTKNLHFVHVGIELKGRTCQACHRTHASDGAKLINRTGASFGAWTMSIDFYLSETGGTCTPGCHRDMSYDRETAVDNSVKQKDYGKYYIDYNSKK